MGILSTGIAATVAKAVGVTVAIGGLTAGAVFAYQTTQGGEAGTAGESTPPATATSIPATTTNTATVLPPTTTPTTAPSTAGPTAGPTATPTFPPKGMLPPTATVDPACVNRTHNHLNIEAFAQQPEMAGATITEIDDNEISVVFQGVTVLIQGVGELVGIASVPGELSNEQLTSLWRAVDAVSYVC